MTCEAMWASSGMKYNLPRSCAPPPRSMPSPCASRHLSHQTACAKAALSRVQVVSISCRIHAMCRDDVVALVAVTVAPPCAVDSLPFRTAGAVAWTDGLDGPFHCLFSILVGGVGRGLCFVIIVMDGRAAVLSTGPLTTSCSGGLAWTCLLRGAASVPVGDNNTCAWDSMALPRVKAGHDMPDEALDVYQ